MFNKYYSTLFGTKMTCQHLVLSSLAPRGLDVITLFIRIFSAVFSCVFLFGSERTQIRETKKKMSITIDTTICTAKCGELRGISQKLINLSSRLDSRVPDNSLLGMVAFCCVEQGRQPQCRPIHRQNRKQTTDQIPWSHLLETPSLRPFLLQYCRAKHQK